MKTNLFIVAAAVLAAHVAFADDSTAPAAAPKTTSATTTLASAEEAGTNASMATDKTAAADNGVGFIMKYTGFFYGPGLDFSGAHEDALNASEGQSDLELNNRPKFLIKVGDNFEAGAETRFNVIFDPTGLKFAADNFRLLANFKNVVKNDLFDLSIIPRVFLPTSEGSHNADMLPSPELIFVWDLNPKNTRFSFNGGVLIGDYFTGSAASNVGNASWEGAETFDINPWVEIDYQLTSTVSPYIAWWPDFSAMGNRGAPIAADSYEVDIGSNITLSKAWTLIPYVAVEPYGMGALSNPMANMELNILLTGRVF